MRTILWTSALLTMMLTLGSDGVVEDQVGQQSSTASESPQKEFYSQGPCQVTDTPLPRCPWDPLRGWASMTMTSESDDVPHLGYTVLSASTCWTPWAYMYSGEAVFTAANGNMLTATFSGGYDWETYWCETWVYGPMEITGGTGRFQNATGTLHSVIDTLFDDACDQVVSSTWTIQGTFSY